MYSTYFSLDVFYMYIDVCRFGALVASRLLLLLLLCWFQQRDVKASDCLFSRLSALFAIYSRIVKPQVFFSLCYN